MIFLRRWCCVTDGAVVAVDFVEGCAAQTETFPSLAERVVPNLFADNMGRCPLELQIGFGNVYDRFRSAIMIIAMYNDAFLLSCLLNVVWKHLFLKPRKRRGRTCSNLRCVTQAISACSLPVFLGPFAQWIRANVNDDKGKLETTPHRAER